MNISINKIVNKKASDPLEILIFEKSLGIKNIVLDKELDLLLVVLTNGSVLKLKISGFPKLSKAKPKQLNNWKLIGLGVGVEWTDLDEDLSLKGFIREASLQRTLHEIETGRLVA